MVFAELALQEGNAGPAETTFRGQREKHLSHVEKGLIKRYLEETEGNVSAAARKAKIPRRTFYRLLNRYGIKGEDFKA